MWNHYRDGVNGSANEISDNDSMKNKNKTITKRSFNYKTKIIQSTSYNNSRLNSEVLFPLKYLSKFWRYLDLTLINSEIELDLKWSKYYLISKILKAFREVDPNADPAVYEIATVTTGITF